MEEPPTGVASPIAALAQAVTAAVLGTATPPETLQLLHSSFGAARSFRCASGMAHPRFWPPILAPANRMRVVHAGWRFLWDNARQTASCLSATTCGSPLGGSTTGLPLVNRASWAARWNWGARQRWRAHREWQTSLCLPPVVCNRLQAVELRSTPNQPSARCSIHQLKDSDRLWALEGSSSFLCVPVLAEGGGGGGCGDWEPQRPTAAAAALLLSYSSTAAAPQE